MSGRKQKRIDEIADERQFLARRLIRENDANVSWVGLSSNWMTVHAIEERQRQDDGYPSQPVRLDSKGVLWPYDEGDFGRCMVTYAAAPVHLRPFMWATLQVFREFVDQQIAGRAPVPVQEQETR